MEVFQITVPDRYLPVVLYKHFSLRYVIIIIESLAESIEGADGCSWLRIKFVGFLLWISGFYKRKLLGRLIGWDIQLRKLIRTELFIYFFCGGGRIIGKCGWLEKIVTEVCVPAVRATCAQVVFPMQMNSFVLLDVIYLLNCRQKLTTYIYIMLFKKLSLFHMQMNLLKSRAQLLRMVFWARYVT